MTNFPCLRKPQPPAHPSNEARPYITYLIKEVEARPYIAYLIKQVEARPYIAYLIKQVEPSSISRGAQSESWVKFCALVCKNPVFVIFEDVWSSELVHMMEQLLSVHSLM